MPQCIVSSFFYPHLDEMADYHQAHVNAQCSLGFHVALPPIGLVYYMYWPAQGSTALRMCSEHTVYFCFILSAWKVPAGSRIRTASSRIGNTYRRIRER